MSKIVLIASGGLDSTVLYYYLKKQGNDIKILNFSYDSKHNEIERVKLKENIKEDIKEINIDLTFLKSALLKEQEQIPEGYYTDITMKSTVIPFRNGIMLSYAIAYADSMDYKLVSIGNHAGDHYIYPDCRTTFIFAMNEASAYGTENNINIISPFNNLSKKDIVKIGIDLNIEKIMYNTWTCYNGRKHHCGKCGACVERKEAFKLNNIIDKTKYEKK